MEHFGQRGLLLPLTHLDLHAPQVPPPEFLLPFTCFHWYPHGHAVDKVLFLKRAKIMIKNRDPEAANCLGLSLTHPVTIYLILSRLFNFSVHQVLVL